MDTQRRVQTGGGSHQFLREEKRTLFITFIIHGAYFSFGSLGQIFLSQPELKFPLETSTVLVSIAIGWNTDPNITGQILVPQTRQKQVRAPCTESRLNEAG